MTTRSSSSRTNNRIRGASSSRSNDHLPSSELKGSSVAGSSSHSSSSTSTRIRATRVPVMAAASGKAGQGRVAAAAAAAASTKSQTVLHEVTNRGRSAASSSHNNLREDLDKLGLKSTSKTSGSSVAGQAGAKVRTTRLASSRSQPDSLSSRGANRDIEAVKGAAARMNAAIHAAESNKVSAATRGQRHQASSSSSSSSNAPPAKRVAVRQGAPSSSRQLHQQQASMDTSADEADDAESTGTATDSLMDEDAEERLAELNALDEADDFMQNGAVGDTTVKEARSLKRDAAELSGEDMSDDEEDEDAQVFGNDDRQTRSRNASASTAAEESASADEADSATGTPSTANTVDTTPFMNSVAEFGDSYDSLVADARLAEQLDPDCLLRLTPDLEDAAQQKKAHIVRQYEETVVQPQLAAARLAREAAFARGEILQEVFAEEDELAVMGLDLDEVRDTSMVAEYADDIFSYMSECERNTMPNPRYMEFQTEIQWYMRGTLVDWLLQVHVRYHLLPETLWIAINIIDRFLSVRVVALQKLQLVGVTSMFIAAKYEEILAPSVDEFVFMTENGYTKEEILKGERIILSTLNFNVSTYCTPYSWVRRISKADDYDVQTRTLSKFLMEVTLLDHRFLRARPSMVAAMSMFLAKKMLNGQWNDAFVYYSNFTEEQLVPSANLVLEKLIDPAFEEQFVCKKYANKKFLKASLYAREWAQQHHRSVTAAAEAAAGHA